MTLENLERVRELRSEAPDKGEFNGLVQGSKDRLEDAENEAVLIWPTAQRMVSPWRHLEQPAIVRTNAIWYFSA